MYFVLGYIGAKLLANTSFSGRASARNLGSERPMVCASVIVADHDPLVVSGVNSTLGAETDSDIAATTPVQAFGDTGHSTGRHVHAWC